MRLPIVFLAVVLGLLLLGGASGAELQSLDGEWQMAQDVSDQGRAKSWFLPDKFPIAQARQAMVPGNVFDTFSISEWPDRHSQIAWYCLNFTPTLAAKAGDHFYLRFGGVNKKSDLWLNGSELGSHDGAESPFEFDVTKTLAPGKLNTLIVRLWSDWFPGLDEHVTLVAQPTVRIVDIFFQPDAKNGKIDVDVAIENNTGAPARVAFAAACTEWKSGRSISQTDLGVTVSPGASTQRLTLPVPHPHLWDLQDPFLYKVEATLNWNSPEGTRSDFTACRTGFRDFRNIGGYFYLNGKRIFLRSLHGGGHFDPIHIWANPSTMTYLSQQFPKLKSAGFNMMRFLQSTPLPEQLDQADEIGFLIYSENETSWHVNDPNQFGTTLNAMVRRDRNHPSLVMWGLLNETDNIPVYQKARDWLPTLRAIDNTRYVELSSGRFEHDTKTGSGSNPGSSTWDVYLGGEGPGPVGDTGNIPDDLGSFRQNMGDVHPYPFYPLSWATFMGIAHLSQNAKPVFVSETGMGSSYDGVNERNKLDRAGAPKDAFAYTWARPMADGVEQTWKRYKLTDTYPDVTAMMRDSAVSSATQREELFSALRSNPKLAGYSLTSIYDAGGAGEGIMDTFGAFKTGHLPMLREGWAPLRWCLLVNPTHIYADQPLRIFASLATEDQLEPGAYPVTFAIRGGTGIVWTKRVTLNILAGGPMAYSLLDEDVRVPNLADGSYELLAELDHRVNAAAARVPFQVTTRATLPDIWGPLTVAGLPASARQFLTDRKATLHDYAPNETIDREVIVIGDGFTGDAAAWRALYARTARGAHLIFLANSVFANGGDALHWLALPNRGTLATNPEWLYHRDYVAKPGPLWAGLRTKLMEPEFFGPMMAHVQFINDIAPAPETAALGIYSTANMDGHFDYHDGLALGTFPFHQGRLTLCGFDILHNLGQPAPDRLLVNIIKQAQTDAAPASTPPADLSAELDGLKIK
jgi:hypothetical protein